jgi:hypothetical protein
MNKHCRLFAVTLIVAGLTTVHAAIITVNTEDNDDFSAGKTNLVTAINSLQDGDTIQFEIPGPGPHYLVTPGSVLGAGGGGGYPEITANNITIDGFSQAGSSPNSNSILAANNASYKIVLDSRAGGSHVWDIDGYGTSESGILVVSGNSFHLQGVCLIGVYGIEDSETNPKIYGVAFGRGAKDGHISGCWFGVDVNGTNVHGINDAVTGFGTTPNGRTERITVGVKDGAGDPKAQHNVIVGEQIPVIIEARDTRIAGNFFGILPDGVTDKGPVENFEGFVEIGRDAANTLIGTDGNGVNDEEERNVFGGVTTSLYGDILEFYSGSLLRTNIVIAGNYFGVGIDGTTLFTNSTVVVDGIASGGDARIGSDFDGVSDAIEGNVIFMNYPFDALFPSPPLGPPPQFLAVDPGARISLRGNKLVNNNLAPFSYADDLGGRLSAFTSYEAPYMSTDGDVIPVLSSSSAFPRLLGTCAPGVEPYTNIIIDVYQLDDQGWNNGKLFDLDELLTSEGVNGFPQGRKNLGSFVENGPSDSDPVVGSFNLDISALDVSAGPVTVTANYSADPPGTHNGRTHTSNFSNPITLDQGGGAPTLEISRSGNSLTISWPASVTDFTLETADNLPASGWTLVDGVVNNSVTVTIGAANKFYRLKQ